MFFFWRGGVGVVPFRIVLRGLVHDGLADRGQAIGGPYRFRFGFLLL